MDPWGVPRWAPVALAVYEAQSHARILPGESEVRLRTFCHQRATSASQSTAVRSCAEARAVKFARRR
eukprot:1150986-Alexandrium_andersonii.AAC.1